MSALSEGSDEKEEEGGRGELRTAVMRTAMLKQCGCNATKLNPQSHTISHAVTRFSSFSQSCTYKTLTETPLQKCHGACSAAQTTTTELWNTLDLAGAGPLEQTTAKMTNDSSFNNPIIWALFLHERSLLVRVECTLVPVGALYLTGCL